MKTFFIITYFLFAIALSRCARAPVEPENQCPSARRQSPLSFFACYDQLTRDSLYVTFANDSVTFRAKYHKYIEGTFSPYHYSYGEFHLPDTTLYSIFWPGGVQIRFANYECNLKSGSPIVYQDYPETVSIEPRPPRTPKGFCHE